MRSRNGNRSVVYASLALITPLVWGAEHYYIGYRLTTKNAQAIEEALTVAKAMQPCGSSTVHASLSLERLPDEPLAATLARSATQFLEFASNDQCRLKSNFSSTNDRIAELQTLTVPTRCYAVDFNDQSVTIGLLK